MRLLWTGALLATLPVSLTLAPRLLPGALWPAPPPVHGTESAAGDASADPAPQRRPVAVASLPELPDLPDLESTVYDPDVELLGAFVWDGCTLAPADLSADLERPDLHVRTSYVSDRRLPGLLDHLGSLGLRGLHLGFYTAPRDLAALSQWRDLRVLTFEGDHLTDDALEPLSSLYDLRMLEMGVRPHERNRTTDRGLRHLATLRYLEYLGLHAWEGVRGDGLRYLAHLDRLRDLELSYTNVDDASLKYLSNLDSLQTLSLQHTRVTDAGLLHLAKLPNLRTLDLRQTLVTPEAAVLLASFSHLERVVLHHNRQFDVIEAVRATGLQADGIGWMRGTVGCEHWERTGRPPSWARPAD